MTAYPPHDGLPILKNGILLTTWLLAHHTTAYPPHNSLPITGQPYPPHNSLPITGQPYPPHNSLPITGQPYPPHNSLPITGQPYPPHNSLPPNLTWPLTHQITVYPSHHRSAFHKFTSINTTRDHLKMARWEEQEFGEQHCPEKNQWRSLQRTAWPGCKSAKQWAALAKLQNESLQLYSVLLPTTAFI